jgi:hypothetical protein
MMRKERCILYNEKNEIINQSIQNFMENEINNFNTKLFFDTDGDYITNFFRLNYEIC